MAQAKEIAGAILLILAMAGAISALVLQKWVILADSVTTTAGTPPITITVTIEFDIGVKEWSLIGTTSSSDGKSKTVTAAGTLSDQASSGSFMDKTAAAKYDAGGTYAIATGSTALVIAFAAVVLTVLAATGRQGKLKLIATILSLLAGAMVILGVVIYARKLDVGFSFILAIAASFLLFAASVSLGSGLIGKAPSKLQQSMGLFLFIAAIAVQITAMSTLGWWQRVETTTVQGIETTSTRSFGLKTWSMLTHTGTTTYETTGSLADTAGLSATNKKFFERLDAGGTNVIITGTIALVVTTASFVLCFLYVCVGPRSGRYQFFGVVLGMLAGGTNFLGVMLYADTLRVGLSFLLFVASAFFFFAGMATLAASFATSTSDYRKQRDMVGMPATMPSSPPGGPLVEEEDGGYSPPAV